MIRYIERVCDNLYRAGILGRCAMYLVESMSPFGKAAGTACVLGAAGDEA